MRLLLVWAVNAATIFLLPYILDAVQLRSFGTALLVALIIGFLNTVIRPVLFVLTLPITVVTLGLFTLVLNGLMFWVTSRMVDGFHIDGFWWAVLAALLYSIISGVISGVLLAEQQTDDRRLPE
ncbi:MAG: phage holin family protein [Lautropia sp.]|nr:phage holin family protein [Lautropia sp.]